MHRSWVISLIVLLIISILLVASPSCGNIAANSWVTMASMPQAVNGARAAAIEGKIYVMGGSSNYMYDPATNTWTQKAPMPNPTMFFAIAAYQNRIYVLGGRGDNGTYAFNQVYYPSNNSWDIKPSVPLAASDLDANVVNGKIYLVWNSENEIYDISTDSWSNGTAMPYPVSAYASAVFQNRIYYFGGMTRPPIPPIYGNYTQIYDPITDTWSSGAPLPTSEQENVAISAVATSGSLSLRRIYVLGGWSSEGFLSYCSNANRVYNPENDSWTFGASMPTGRVGVALAVVNDRIFAIGGSPIYISSSAVNEQYYPLGYGTPDPNPTATQSPTVPEFSAIAIVPLLLSVFFVVLVLRYRKVPYG